ncbi:MAG TPA: hypothetical protein VM674_01905 [Candidatus Acidoferrum sp.]|nr:hypothetical protein [Candidatus Acidoferrum sp.]
MPEAAPPNVPLAQRPAPSRIDGWRQRPSSVLGGLLVAIGAVMLIGQFVHFDFGRYGWPFWIIVPGVLLMIMAVTSRGFFGEGLAIVGSMTTVTGLILLVQNLTDHFASWAYAWALIFPASIGIGMILYGLTAGHAGNVRAGLRLVAVGVILFVLGAAFFEGVIWGGIEFGTSSGVVLGVVIIGVGLVLVVLNLASRRRSPF